MAGKKQEAATVDLTEFKKNAELLAELEVAGDTDNQRKKDLWIAMGEDLQDQGYPKNKIAQEIVKAVESRLLTYYKKKGIEPPKDSLKINSGWFYVVMRERQWVSGKFGNEPSPIGNGEDSSDFVLEVPEGSQERERRNKVLRFYQDAKKECETAIEELLKDEDEITDEVSGDVKLKVRNWTRILDDMEVNDSEGTPFRFAMDLFYSEAEDRRRKFDARQLLLPQSRPAINAICFFATNQDFADHYFIHCKPAPTITPKKLAQYFKDSNSFSDLCKLALEDPYLINSLEVKCPDCEEMTLKIQIYKNGSWDLVCKNTEYHKNDIVRAKTPEERALIEQNTVIVKAGTERTRYIRHYHPAFLQNRLVCLRDNIGGAAYRYLERKFPEILKRIRNEPDEDVIARLRASGELPKIDESKVV